MRTRPAVSTGDCSSPDCHGDLLDRKAVHGPAAVNACGDCHAYLDPAQHRFKPFAEIEGGCVRCHKEARPVPGTAMSTHAPARDNCLACHDPHGSNDKHALKQAVPGLCLSCHTALKESLAHSSVPHGAMAQDQSCLACHVSHFSKLPMLQKEPQPQQCLNCHDRTLKTGAGRQVANMAALLKENPEHHGPIRLGACTACHQPHAGNLPWLLSAAYPPEFYAPFSAERYQLCFSCHTPQLVLDAKPSAPTGFKDGQRNLHALHVNQEKGRTCRACHEVHASRQPFHVPDAVPFGPNAWPITLRYRKTETGGACEAGCHGPKSYDHGRHTRALSVVAFLPKGQALLTAQPSTQPSMPPEPAAAPAARSGGDYAVPPPPFTPGVFPCTACHDPMLAVNAQRRELRKPHENITLRHDEQHRWCLDCHNAQNRDVLRSAAGEPIPFAESYRLCGQCHGTQYRDWKVGVHGKRTGEWNGRKEYLLCVHCHDPHSPKFRHMAPLPAPVRPKSK